MRLIILFVTISLSFNPLRGLAKFKSYADDSIKIKQRRKSTTNVVPGPVNTTLQSQFKNLLSKKFDPDTADINSINPPYDTTLVMNTDFPMPVNKDSYFENALFKKRLDSLQKLIPLNYNEYVQSYINLFIYKRRSLIERLLGESKYYFPIFEKALTKFQMPIELKYLPIIESALNPFAVSRMGATGPWQFMAGTGKDYGLTINGFMDERRDPYRSTQAAAQYLKDMYDRYGDWLLVIASYNCGKGNVDKAIRKAHGSKDFWVIQRYLPKETRTYVPAYIAIAYSMNYATAHGLHCQLPDFNIRTDSILVSQNIALSAIAESLCSSGVELQHLNPQFKYGMVLATSEIPKMIIIPLIDSAKIKALQIQLRLNPEMYAENIPGFRPYDSNHSFLGKLFRHRVHRGETLVIIADRYSCTIKDLKKWNHLHSNWLIPGQKLKVKEIYAGNFSKGTRNRKLKGIHSLRHYKVRKGDTLKEIANRYNIPIKNLKGINRLHSNMVKEGQNLKLVNRI